MTGRILVIGDRSADPLLPLLESDLVAEGLSPRVVSPCALAGVRLACGVDWCMADGEAVAAVVFRASPTLLVAAEYGEEDAAFAAAELRAVWAHVLSIPAMAAVNRAHAETWFSSSEWSFWRQRLASRGIGVAPQRIGRPYPEGTWTRWTGGGGPVPDAVVAERLGIATVASRVLTPLLCCAGGVISADPRLAALAEALLEEGLVLAEVLLDQEHRIAGMQSVPAISPADAPEVSVRLAEWLDAAVRR